MNDFLHSIFSSEPKKQPKVEKTRFKCINRYRRGLETCPQAKTSKSGHAVFFFFFFPNRPSDEYDSAPSRKYSRPLLDVFACIAKMKTF